MREIPETLRSRPFTTKEALEAGLTKRVLYGSRFRRLFQGAHVEATVEDSVQTRVDGASLLLPSDAIFGYNTAAELFGFPAPRTPEVHVVLPRHQPRPEVEGITVHRPATARVDTVRVRERVVTSPEQTWVDLADSLSLDECIALGDAVLHYLVALDWRALEPAVANAWKRPGIERIRQAIPHLEPRTESPAETWLRLVLLRGGLPRPRSNHDLHNEAGWIARPDLLYLDPPVAIQYDGAIHFDDARRRRRDASRDELTRDLGWEVVTVNALDRAQPRRVVDRVLGAFDRARGRTVSGFVSDPWPERVAIARPA